jgi:allophanate hydrolase
MITPEPGITDFDALQLHYLRGTLQPRALVRQVLARIDASDRPDVWISRVPDDALMARADQLQQALQRHGERILQQMPLFGLPFAVKDNIDVAGLPTTAACPAFAYAPATSAHVVQKLEAAGAILIGKTNLDQFATGLVGTRSPHGAVRNSIDPAYVSGGSSSGSAVAVALGLVSFSLGTDTAGSGRVPAGLNNIVGLKPTRGLLSTQGVVPACRTLDCVSVFAHSAHSAWRVVQAAAGFDAADAYSRPVPMLGVKCRSYRVALPEQLEFFGDLQAEQAFAQALVQLESMPGIEIVRIPFKPFADAAQLLYAGPWVAERRAAVGSFFDQHAQDMDPTVRTIIGQADQYSAVDAFNGQYRLAALRREAETLMADVDFLVVPTTPTMPTLAAVAQEPIKRNSELGYYTNFVNFFDMAALSVPSAARADGLPAGITLIGPAGSDHRLAAAGAAFLAPGSDAAARLAADPLPFNEPTVQVAVAGAHLDAQPLNWQLLERGARKLAAVRTSGRYRLFALAGTAPPKPALVRVASGGAPIEVEVWEMPARYFGSFVAGIPAPLGIGSVELEDGSLVPGFIGELGALAGAEDITGFGGWRAYLASK